jgi:hypothetical protein
MRTSRTYSLIHATMRRSAPLAAILSFLMLVGCSLSSGPQVSPTPEATSNAEPTTAREYHVTEPQLTAMQEDNATLTVQADFAEDRPGTQLRVEGRSYPLIVRNESQYVFANVKVPKLGDNNAKLDLPAAGSSSGIVVEFKIHREMQTIDEYRKYATPLDYKLVNKNPDAHKGEYVKGRAKIYQITEDTADSGGPSTSGGLSVTNYGYGNWDDNVRFAMIGTTDFVESDVVNYYGVINGAYSYESQAGWNITTPMVRIDFMEK